MKILITGGAGFIGSNLVEKLIQNKHYVIVIDNLETGSQKNIKKYFKNKNFKFIKGDFANVQILNRLSIKFDVIIHMATSNLRVSLNNYSKTFDTNSAKFFKFIDQVTKKKKCKKFVYISSSEVYGDTNFKYKNEKDICNPKTVYAATKLEGEYLSNIFCNRFNIPCLIIRPFNTFGKNSHLTGKASEIIPRSILRLLHGQSPVIYGNGDQERDYIEVGNLVNQIYSIIKNFKLFKNKIINIGTGNPVKLKKLIRLIMEILKVNKKIKYLSDRPGDYKFLSSKNLVLKKYLKNEKQNFKKDLEKYIKYFLLEINHKQIDIPKSRNW
tara:strand:- start:44 stop:1021 length:978 start_codon:yes stop_codon:yes gene_type:complete